MRGILAFMWAVVAALAIGVTPVAAKPGANEIVWGENLPKALDPHVIYDVPMQFYMLNTYDTLFRYVGNPPELKPWLVESEKVSDDGLTWTLNLKKGVKFHDGSELTAADVVYSFKRLLALGKGPSGAFKPVLKADNVSAPSSHTVEFKLNHAYAPFRAVLPLVAIVNPRAIKPNEKGTDWGSAWLSSNEAGSGAYQLDPKTYRPLEVVDLMRFKGHFYGWKDNPHPVDIIRAHTVKETSTRVLAVIKGDIDATDSYLPTDQVERVQKSANARVARDESMRVMIIRMNNAKPPFDNLNFRKCMSYAFNYKGFISVILKDYAVRNAGPIPKNLWGAPQDLKGYNYDPKKAKEYCDKAKAEGAPVDREMEIHIQSALAQTTQAAELLQADVRKLGINLKLVASTWAQLTSSAGKASTTPDMWVHWVSTYFVDPENWIGQMYDSQFHGTWKASSWYKNDKVDKLLREARLVTDQAKRKALYEEASRIVVGDAADIWIYNTIQLRGLSKRVQGYKFSPVGSGGELRWVSLKN